ncbi:MAG TPA: class I SAM-dependent methyltransferase [Candidatus Sulfotelmatobacter sp.]|nr:class I SAM-dependent methyltransferase [Candidatus Sulfotelmatobacter sp.]
MTAPAAYRAIDRCRICGNRRLVSVLNLGEQYLTGVFPHGRDPRLTRGPLELMRCDGEDACGLVQLRHSYDHAELYGANYGYRSSLNGSMVRHLADKVARLRRRVSLTAADLVIDVGSNDGTLLSNYPAGGPALVGIDPTAAKFRSYYRPDIRVIADFFSAGVVRANFPDRRARLVTSVAMFYDLDAPQAFADEIAGILAEDGVWHFEQSYLPSMLHRTSYDTICHEHLEYYGLGQIKWIVDRAGLKIIDVSFNDVNGGSFAVSVAHRDAPYPEALDQMATIIVQEAQDGLRRAETYAAFAARVVEHRDRLRETLRDIRSAGRRVVGYGASTKGNVILQYCGLTEADIPCIGEVNRDKFGCVTPGTWIPIVSEAEAKADRPDYLLVLPWHFRDNLIARERAYLDAGGRMIFPLPAIEIVGGDAAT